MRKCIATTLTLTILSLAGCFLPQKPYTSIDGTWPSQLDGDLRLAVSHLSTDLSAEGYPNVVVLWAGARDVEYRLERGPTGLPLAKFAQVAYAFQLPDGKCYINIDFTYTQTGAMLVRTNEGGSRYGEPRVRGGGPPRGGYGNRHEVLCDAVAQAKGGVHLDGAPAAATATNAVVSIGSKDGSEAAPVVKEYDPQEALSTLAANVAPACRQYATAACTNPHLPAGTDRKYFCSRLVSQTNDAATKPTADKTCKAMLKNTPHDL